MGQFIFDNRKGIELEDRALAHLQRVIIDKLRRHEHFSLSLTDGRRHVITWMTPSAPMEFVYSGSRPPTMNHSWLEALAQHAAETGIVALLPEPDDDA